MIEQCGEQCVAQRGRVTEQLGAVGVALNPLLDQGLESGPGGGESAVGTPGCRHIAASAGRVLDRNLIAGLLQLEDEFLADGQAGGSSSFIFPGRPARWASSRATRFASRSSA